MLKRLKTFFSRSTFLSGARRLGWVRLREFSAAQREIDVLRARGDVVAEDLRLAAIKSTALAQQLEIWRGRAAEYKLAVASNVERLAASRARVQDLAQQAEHLRAGQADAEERARNLIAAMRARELEAAQNLSLMRASLGRTRQADALGSSADRERLLFAEIDRLKTAAEAKGQTLHLAYDFEPLLGQLRAGRMVIVPLSLETLVGDFPLRSGLLLTAQGEVGADLKDITDRGAFNVRPLLLHRPENAEPFDTVVIAFDLDNVPDPVAAIGAAADCVSPGGKLVIFGSASQSAISDSAMLWRTPPKMLQSLLPRWTWDRFIFAGPGGKIGIEIVDPALLLEIRPALGKGAPLLTPPYMSCVAVARNESGVER